MKIDFQFIFRLHELSPKTTGLDLPHIPISDYALQYAPLIRLHSQERHWPSKATEHLLHTVPLVNRQPLNDAPIELNLGNVDFNNTSDMYLAGMDDISADSDWIRSEYGKPNSDQGGRSQAPALIIAVDKAQIVEPGVVDVFYFFFYSFNLGNSVFGRRYGNHLGDWEHTLIRFKYGIPQTVYLSEHKFGSAYNYSVMSRQGKRPIVYSGLGTHAMYATAGSHHYTKLGPLLGDHTDDGPLWDITLNYEGYTYSKERGFLPSSAATPPTNWLDFVGRWGDQQFPDSDPRQYHIFNHYGWIDGPTGPNAKNLLRHCICETLSGDDCIILDDPDDIYVEVI